MFGLKAEASTRGYRKCMLKSLVNFTRHQILLTCSNPNGLAGLRGTYGKIRNVHKIVFEKPEGTWET